jgi:CDP-paratose 2-epimerase
MSGNGVAKKTMTFTPTRGSEGRPVLITGAAGFIGTNLAHRLLSAGIPVLLFDNLSRPGVERNVRWLRDVHGERLRLELSDVRDPQRVSRAVAQSSAVFHFAGQTAVTTSLVSPVDDFEVNARGTLNVLEALRALSSPPPLVFTSTNKVYGNLGDIGLRDHGGRYEPVAAELRERGVGEGRAIDFHSPYGCSKGCADQYVLDYTRSFGLSAVVFRMSCIYGPHQLGTEDQGWLAHFVLRALAREPIVIYGDGRQVRDVLYVDDLVDAFLLAHEHMDALSGQAFNIGGGAENTLSLLELIDMLNALGAPCQVRFEDWRVGDQRYYVSDTERFRVATGWRPRVSARNGVEQLYRWMAEHRSSALKRAAATQATI